MEYLYRVDKAKFLNSIMQDGYWCGSARNIVQPGAGGIVAAFEGVDITLPLETALAKREGWPIPPSEHMECPRLYFFAGEKYLQNPRYNENPAVDVLPDESIGDEYLAFRFPKRLLLWGNCYPDGLCAEQGVAYYCVFPPAIEGDSVISSGHIEVRFRSEWVSLSAHPDLTKFNLIPAVDGS